MYLDLYTKIEDIWGEMGDKSLQIRDTLEFWAYVWHQIQMKMVKLDNTHPQNDIKLKPGEEVNFWQQLSFRDITAYKSHFKPAKAIKA